MPSGHGKVSMVATMTWSPVKGIYVTDDKGYVPFVIVTVPSLFHDVTTNMTCYQIYTISNMKGVTSGIGIAYASWASELSPVFL